MEEHDHRAGPSPAALVFAGLPVVLAVGAGAIYAAGAVTTLASLLRSRTGAEEVFVQIPIEQHLAHGLEYVVHPEICAGLFVVLLVFAWEMQDRPSITAALARASRRKGLRAAIIAAAVALAIFVQSRWLATLAIAAPATVLVYLTVASRPAPRRPLEAPLTLVLVTFAIVFVVADAFIAPTPLPDASLRMRIGAGIPPRGKLLVRTDAAWFLATGSGRYASFPASAVTSAEVKYGQEGHGKSLFRLVFG